MTPLSFHLLGAVTQTPEEDSQANHREADQLPSWGSSMSPDHMQSDQEGGSQSDETGIVWDGEHLQRSKEEVLL